MVFNYFEQIVLNLAKKKFWKIFSFHPDSNIKGDILHQSGSPIDARQLSQSQVYKTPPPPGEMRQPNYREEGELHLRDLPPFAPPPPPRTHQQNTPQYSY